MSRAHCSGRRHLAAYATAVAVGALCVVASAQTPTYPGIGRTPTTAELQRWDFAIGPSGRELPTGNGTAKIGAVIYTSKCAICHGAALTGTIYGPRLIGSHDTLTTLTPMRTVGSFWPYATTLWDYINRAMPRAPFKEGSLTSNEVYALTAFVLFRNGIIPEDLALDARSVPEVRMPNREGFFPAKPDWQWYQSACHLGRCQPSK